MSKCDAEKQADAGYWVSASATLEQRRQAFDAWDHLTGRQQLSQAMWNYWCTNCMYMSDVDDVVQEKQTAHGAAMQTYYAECRNHLQQKTLAAENTWQARKNAFYMKRNNPEYKSQEISRQILESRTLENEELATLRIEQDERLKALRIVQDVELQGLRDNQDATVKVLRGQQDAAVDLMRNKQNTCIHNRRTAEDVHKD